MRVILIVVGLAVVAGFLAYSLFRAPPDGGLAVGQPAPDFTAQTLDGQTLRLADLRGKVVVLDFWGTWCPPCVKAVPDLRDLQKKHGKDAFALIGISSDTDEQILRDFVAKNQMEWTQYWDRDRKVQQIYGIRAWPTYIVIDREGVIRLRTTGNNPTEYSRLVSEVKRQLRAAP